MSVLNKLSWEASWSCQSQVRCSGGQDNPIFLEACRCAKRMEHEESQSSENRHRSHWRECAVAKVLSRKSTIWRRAIVKTSPRKRHMKYIDVEGMRVVTNDKHIAEQIKSDSTLSARECLLNRKVDNVVMNGPEVGTLVKEQKLKSIVIKGVMKGKGDMVKSVVMNGVKSGKFGKSENCENVEETMSRSEERLCKSNHKRSRETQS